jgi:hypothetical protein
MSLDPQLWANLEAHGLHEEHLTLLLRLLEVQKNGSLSWNFVHGHLQQVDARITIASRPIDLLRVGEALGDGTTVP